MGNREFGSWGLDAWQKKRKDMASSNKSIDLRPGSESHPTQSEDQSSSRVSRCRGCGEERYDEGFRVGACVIKTRAKWSYISGIRGVLQACQHSKPIQCVWYICAVHGCFLGRLYSHGGVKMERAYIPIGAYAYDINTVVPQLSRQPAPHAIIKPPVAETKPAQYWSSTLYMRVHPVNRSAVYIRVRFLSLSTHVTDVFAS